MKNVIHYKADSYLPLTENWIYGQIRHLQRYQPAVYCGNTENLDAFRVDRIRSLRLTRRSGIRALLLHGSRRLFGFYPNQAFCLLIDRPRLIHAHFGPSGYEALALKRISRLPLITSFYGYDLSGLPRSDPAWGPRYQELFSAGDCFLVEGGEMKTSLIALGCPEDKVTVHHLGVDLDRISFVPRHLRDGEEVGVLIASSFREKKGIPCALEAFGIVRGRQPGLKMKLSIIGDSDSGAKGEEEKARILAMIEKYSLRDNVSLLGYQPIARFYNELYRHHIFMAASMTASDGDTEGGAPVSVIEASASGMPVLATTHCDIPEVIIDSESGYLAPEGDSGALAERLERLVTNPGTWASMGLRGRRHIEKAYDAKRQAGFLEEIYDKVLETRHGSLYGGKHDKRI